jgi:hypothetical protein
MSSFLYVIGAHSGGPMKLGISADPNQRVRQLQTGHADRLRVYHTEPVPEDMALVFEKLLHRDVGHLRRRGGKEWFDLTVEQAIAQVQFTIIQYDGVDNLVEKVRTRRI